MFYKIFYLQKCIFVFGLYENIRRSVHIEITGLLFTGLPRFTWLLQHDNNNAVCGLDAG